MALLFARPSSAAIAQIDEDLDYFDVRSADTWDLFFPGYFRSDDPEREEHFGGRRVGSSLAASWLFNANDFNIFRAEVERRSAGRWTYSGGADLVLINAWLTADGTEPTVDWSSTVSGQLRDRASTASLPLDQIVERISEDLERSLEDPHYGVGAVVAPDVVKDTKSISRDVTVGALGGIAAALGKAGLGL